MAYPTSAILLALALGCATSTTSTRKTLPLTAAQVADLQQRAQSPEALGIQIHTTDQGTEIHGANQATAEQPVTVAMVEVPGGDADDRFGLPVVKATASSAELRVLVDSGSNRNLLGYSVARRLGVATIAGLGPVTGLGFGGTIQGYYGVIPQLQIGELTLQRVLVVIVPDADVLTFARKFGADVPLMVLGVNALNGLSSVSLDARTGKVAFEVKAAYLPSMALSGVGMVPLRWEDGLPTAVAVFDGRFRMPAVLDTGGNYGLVIPRSRASQMDYLDPGTVASATARGVGGESGMVRYEVDRLQLGSFQLNRVPAQTDLTAPETGNDLISIGNVVLRRYRVTFDFQKNALWLER